MLRLDNITKCYGDYLVFQGLTHTFTAGCYALSEEDSTGKSTLLRIIAGLIAPDSGSVTIQGRSILGANSAAKACVAYVPDNCMLFPELTGRQLLDVLAKEKRLPLGDDVFRLARQLGLEPHLDKRFEQMSTGTRRKVYLAAAAMGAPAVIVADGPTDGLDTQARMALAAQFRAWGQGRVVLFASHDADFVLECGAHPVEISSLCVGNA